MFQDLFRIHEKNTYATVIRDGKIYYINAGLLKDGEIEEIMDKWWETKGLMKVLDKIQ